jgi:predicted metal-dependent phosphoesterase TrpH
MSPQEVVDVSLRKGLGALAITDHNTLGGARAVQRLAPFPVVVGEEISTSDGEMLALFLEQEVPRGLPAGETLRLIHEQGGLAGVSHPFDRLRRESLATEVLESLSDRLDFLEVFNGRVTLPEDNRRAKEFALGHGLANAAGSDGTAGSNWEGSAWRCPLSRGDMTFWSDCAREGLWSLGVLSGFTSTVSMPEASGACTGAERWRFCSTLS